MKNFNIQIQNQFAKMAKTGKLFRADISGREIYDAYLNFFEEGTNPKFRDPESSTHNCNNCNNFIRRYGNIVAIDEDGSIITLFTGLNLEEPYKIVADKLDSLISSKPIANVFFETLSDLTKLPYEKCNKTQAVYQLGVAQNHKQYTKDEAEAFGVVKEGEIREFNHFNLQLPKQFVDQGSSIEALIAGYRDKYSVFKRAMKEISLDTLNLVKDLINQDSLLDGQAHLHSIDEFILLKEVYQKNPTDNWIWWVIYEMDERVAKFKNTLIGVLCSELSEGEEINKACQNWNKRVDPINYHKVTAPITKKQIAEAQKFVEENGYEASFDRRLAVMDDIKASEIKHINTGNGEIKKVSIFDDVKSTSTRHKRSKFDNVEEISIDKFMKDILPSCSSVEAYLKNSHERNLVTLTTSKEEEVKSIFKWSNPYSWNFNGNLAGKSQIKESVKSQGGKVDGVLRFSIMWAENNADNSDLDAHCVEPNGYRIFYPDLMSRNTGGNLDIDIMQPNDHPKDVVENITYPSLSRMEDGVYKLMVHQYAARNSQGFKAEIEFAGELYSYEYTNPLSNKSYIQVAEVTLNNGEFTIKHLLLETASSKELWGLETNNFHKVNLVCLSPNHWDENTVGNKHYMFMLDKCKTSTGVRGFHNENLLPDLLKYRKVMEVLGATNMIEPTGKQLSGLGFNATVRDELIVKCSGNFKRVLKIKF